MWYYLVDGRQEGPVDDAQFESLIEQGVINSESQIWKEGQADWTPLGTFRRSGLPAVIPPPVGPAGTCEICHQPVGATNLIELAGVRVCANCKPIAIQKLQEGIALGSDTVWVDGKSVVANDGALFPPRCYKCNAPVSGAPIKTKLYWHNPLYLLTIFISIIVYIIVALIVRKRATIEVFVCPEHRHRRRMAVIVCWVLLILGVVLIASGLANTNTAWISGIGLLVLIAGIVAGMGWGRLVIPRRIKDNVVWMRGAGKEFCASLPPWPGR
jgi:hypothetical protein